MTKAERVVKLVNDAFYQAFSNRDIAAMEELWSRAEDVVVIHPGWAPICGRSGVLLSWRRILAADSSPQISCVDARLSIHGDTAIVTCTELLAETELVATNIFVREQDSWKMIHHHSGPLPVSSLGREGDTLH